MRTKSVLAPKVARNSCSWIPGGILSQCFPTRLRALTATSCLGFGSSWAVASWKRLKIFVELPVQRSSGFLYSSTLGSYATSQSTSNRTWRDHKRQVEANVQHGSGSSRFRTICNNCKNRGWSMTRKHDRTRRWQRRRGGHCGSSRMRKAVLSCLDQNDFSSQLCPSNENKSKFKLSSRTVTDTHA
jgi:hypothetical protein